VGNGNDQEQDVQPEVSEEQRTAAAQFMTTEYTALHTARSATIFDANGRASLFLSSVASAVVALAFIGQVSGIGVAFYLFGLVLFATLCFLGVATFHRVLQSAIEDMAYAREINRIRHFYLEQAPQIAPYLLLSANDDQRGMLVNMRASPSPWPSRSTTD
jgi:hypothetical protein